MLEWVRVNSRSESILVSDPFVDLFSISNTMDNANQSHQMTLKDYMYLTSSTQPSCITLLPLIANLKSNPTNTNASSFLRIDQRKPVPAC